jgi:hypothetical protein
LARGRYFRDDRRSARHRFGELKLGDTVNARYYDNVIIRVKQPGESEVLSGVKGTTGSEQVLPGGTRAKQLTITATITAIEREVARLADGRGSPP